MSLAAMIESTALKADLLNEEVDRLCDEALHHQMGGVCIPPYFVPRAAKLLQNSTVKIVSVIGFPLGYHTTSAKVESCRKLIEDGVHELDMVMHIAAFKNKDYKYVLSDIDSVATICRLHNRQMKLIIETGLLTEKEMEKACELAVKGGADFVKTGTGYHTPVNIDVVTKLRSWLPSSVKIKASGGIREAAQALALKQAGADRLGTSQALAILLQESAV